MESIEYISEAVLIESLKLKPTLSVMDIDHSDDRRRTDEFSGIVVTCTSAGVVSRSATGAIDRRIERIQATVSLRGMTISDDPDFPAQRNSLWRDIADGILRPVLPAGKTWVEILPSLSKVAFFHRLDESQSSREESDDRRSHQRTFELFVSLRAS